MKNIFTLILILFFTTTSFTHALNLENPNFYNNIYTYTISDFELTFSIENPACELGDHAAIDLNIIGGSGNFSYNWSNGATTQDISNLANGCYTVSVTDLADNFMQTETICIETPALTATYETVPAMCPGDNAASITASASGGSGNYVYVWSIGTTGPTIENLAQGVYFVTITDTSWCLNTFLVTETTQVMPMELSANITQPLCYENSDGMLSLGIFGGIPPYSIAWNNGSTSSQLNGIPAGDYSVTVTDGNTCSVSAAYTLEAPEALLLVGTTNDPSCFEANDGTISLNISGGLSPYSVFWDFGNTSSNLVDLPAGNYSVTVIDANMCSSSESFTLEAPNEILIESISNSPSCFEANDGAIDLNISGGLPPYSILWNSGNTSSNLNDLPAGNYSVTVVDASMCSTTDSFTLEAPTAIVFNEVTISSSCGIVDNGMLSVDVLGGTPPYSILWQNGDTTFNLENLAAGDYSATVTDNNLCTLTETFSLPEFTVVSNAGNPTCTGLNDGSIFMDVLQGSPPYIFEWSNGSNAQDQEQLPAGNYSVTVTDSNQCSYSENFVLTELTVVAITNYPTCHSNNDGAITLDISWGEPPYSIEWADGETSIERFNLPGGDYPVSVMDANNCTSVITIMLPAPPPLSFDFSIADATGDDNGVISIDTIYNSTPPHAFLWNTGATESAIENLGAGVYEVTISDSNNCLIVGQFGLINTSTSDFDSKLNVALWPNPADDFMTLEANLPHSSTMQNLYLRDISGKIVHTIKTADIHFSTTIEVTNLPEGLYFLFAEKQLVKKLVVQH